MKSIFLIMMVSLPVFAGQLAQDSAHGLSCRYPPDIKEEFRYSDAIFLGKAITKEYAPGIQPDIPEYAKTKFQVIESFKGPVSDTLTIRSDERTWGFVFTENTEYVVFADEQDGHLWHQLCSPTGTPDSVDLYQIRKIAQKYVASPLKQLDFGTPIEQIKCKEGLELILKSSDGSPACVRSQTIPKLTERGWGITYLDKTIGVNGTEHSIKYRIDGNATFTGITYSNDTNSVIIEIAPVTKGNLIIELPRTLIDSGHTNCNYYHEMDAEFVVLADKEEIFFEEITNTSEKRTLSIPFTEDNTEVEIVAMCLI